VYSLSEGVELGVATGKDALAYGGSWFAKNSNKQLLGWQLESLVKARFVIGAGISSMADLKEQAKVLWGEIRDSKQN
jgi:hypothetical protein